MPEAGSYCLTTSLESHIPTGVVNQWMYPCFSTHPPAHTPLESTVGQIGGVAFFSCRSMFHFTQIQSAIGGIDTPSSPIISMPSYGF